MTLIDGDRLNDSIHSELCADLKCDACSMRTEGGGCRVEEWIDKAPSIDIVRCKECKHNYNTAINHGKMQPRCDFADWKLTENDFCSRGEREDER